VTGGERDSNGLAQALATRTAAMALSVVLAMAALLAASGAWAAGRGDAVGRPLRLGGGQPVRAPALKVGDPAPEAMLETLDGDHLWVSQLKGKVVVLDFWASWCGPCIAALPSMKKLARAHGDGPFMLLSISGDANGARLREFVANHEMGWTQCWDGNSDAQRAYGVRGFPTYFVIDRAGRILYVKSGWGRGAEQELGREIEKALAAGGERAEVVAGADRAEVKGTRAAEASRTRAAGR
jgi:thiol-disulfide isomerase/thioredoxin